MRALFPRSSPRSRTAYLAVDRRRGAKSHEAKSRSAAKSHCRRSPPPSSKAEGQWISMRVGFLLALDEQNARALLNAVEDDFGAVRRNVEIADHEACWQISQLALGSGLRIQLPEILPVDPAAKKNQ